MIFSPSEILFGDQFKINEMGGTCGTDGGDTCIQGFGGGKLREREHLAYIGLDGRIILKWILQKQNRIVGTGFMWLRIVTDGWLLTA